MLELLKLSACPHLTVFSNLPPCLELFLTTLVGSSILERKHELILWLQQHVPFRLIAYFSFSCWSSILGTCHFLNTCHPTEYSPPFISAPAGVPFRLIAYFSFSCWLSMSLSKHKSSYRILSTFYLLTRWFSLKRYPNTLYFGSLLRSS